MRRHETYKKHEVYKEKVDYDSANFPLYIRKGDLVYYPDMSATCHWHEDLEFMYIKEGYLDYNIDGKIIQLNEGDGLFVNAQHLHYGFSRDGSDCKYYCILLNPILLHVNSFIEEKFLQTLTSNQTFSYKIFKGGSSAAPNSNIDSDSSREFSADASHPLDSKCIDLLIKIYETYEAQEPGFEMELEGYFFLLWSLLYRMMPTPEEVSPVLKKNLSVLKNMVSYVQENSTEKITLSDIAKSGNVAVSTCSSIFVKHMQRTPMEFLRDVRLSNSRTLLAETDLSITEISHQCGFSGSSYFTECFRGKYAETPKAFRKKMQG